LKYDQSAGGIEDLLIHYAPERMLQKAMIMVLKEAGVRKCLLRRSQM